MSLGEAFASFMTCVAVFIKYFCINKNIITYHNIIYQIKGYVKEKQKFFRNLFYKSWIMKFVKFRYRWS